MPVWKFVFKIYWLNLQKRWFICVRMCVCLEFLLLFFWVCLNQHILECFIRKNKKTHRHLENMRQMKWLWWPSLKRFDKRSQCVCYACKHSKQRSTVCRPANCIILSLHESVFDAFICHTFSMKIWYALWRPLCIFKVCINFFVFLVIFWRLTLQAKSHSKCLNSSFTSWYMILFLLAFDLVFYILVLLFFFKNLMRQKHFENKKRKCCFSS